MQCQGMKWLFLVILQLPQLLSLIGKDHLGELLPLVISTLVLSVLLWYSQHMMCYKGQIELLAWREDLFASLEVCITNLYWLVTDWVLSFIYLLFIFCLSFHWHIGGITLNIKWLEGMFYAVLNICTANNMAHSQVLQLLNKVFLSVHYKDCKADEASCPKFQLTDFVNTTFAKNMFLER